MVITRPIACLDTETTGTDPVTDRILELGVTVLHVDGTRTKWEQRFNPGFHIPDEATAIHGIKDEDLASCPPFAEFASKIHRALQGKDIAGYSVRLLDLPIIDEELRRCGLSLDLTGVSVIDAHSIFVKKEPRDLVAAVRKYCNRDHTDAHGAASDADATLDVILGQLQTYEDLGAMDAETLTRFCWRDEGKQPADLAGKLYRDAEGDLRYTLAKVRDIRVKDDPGFAYWMLRQENPPFSGSTCDLLRAELGLASPSGVFRDELGRALA